MCEVLREKIKGCTWEGRRGRCWRAQLEDLLIALADRRSFPETRFFVARGIVGETWSTESVAPAVFPASVLTLPVKEPRGKRWRESLYRDRAGQTWHWALCDCCLSQHALSCMWLLPQPRLPNSSDFHQHSHSFTMQTVKKTKQNKEKQVSGFKFVLPLHHWKVNKIFQQWHAFFTCCR